MPGRLRLLPLIVTGFAGLLAGCPSRGVYDVPDGGPVDAPVAWVDARPPPDAFQPQVCGDGVCVAGESCACPQDCGECTSVCGDGWCQFGVEDCTTCPNECGTCPGTCGDGRCDELEGCWTCVADCGECTGCDHGECETGTALLATCNGCTASVCEVAPSCCEVAWDAHCVAVADQFCLVGCTPPVCGDLFCDRDDLETCFNCPQDCECLGCEHTVCEVGPPLSADCAPCMIDICMEMPSCCRDAWEQACIVLAMENCFGGCGGFCGDGICGGDEQCCEFCSPCEEDCGPCCGNGTCDTNLFFRPDLNESCSICSGDCGVCPPVCGDGVCAAEGESCTSCAGDCGTCLANCGDGVCVRNQGENCETCLVDCPTCP